MNNKQSKRKRDIKTKLMAAVSMLLVSSIMMVSSTYAWFTLSTAPEVTGITTAVGANGNLEMALLPTDGVATGIASAVGDSYVATNDYTVTNITWGNLVDLSTGYGLDQISLYPSKLNLDANGAIKAAMLSTPEYGADGRVSILAEKTTAGTYYNNVDGKTGFFADENYGVRGIGVASGMTDRQLAYRNAASEAKTAMSSAKNAVVNSLLDNGGYLADIAIKGGTAPEGSPAEFNLTEVNYINAAVAGLQTAVGHIERAYMQYLVVYAASGAVEEDLVWNAVKSIADDPTKGLAHVQAVFEENNVDIPTAISDYFDRVTELKNAVDSAIIPTPEGTTEFTWEVVKNSLGNILDTDEITINGFTVADALDNKDTFANKVIQNQGIELVMPSGSGAYADVADQVGDYKVSITIAQVSAMGVTLTNIPASMETTSKEELEDPYITTFGEAASANDAPAGQGGENPLTEFYGYVIDLAFRTNALNSKLKLQVEATDRIYSDNTNENTMGHGSSMTFASTNPTSFKDAQVKELMKAIRIVFFDPDPDNKTVIMNAKLDVEHATTTADGITANMYLYTVGTDGNETIVASNEITSLDQNIAKRLSVLVYLDGDGITNAAVAANAAKSITGTMNLQFSSSATLVPMEYADLHTPAETPTNPTNPDENPTVTP